MTLCCDVRAPSSSAGPRRYCRDSQLSYRPPAATVPAATSAPTQGPAGPAPQARKPAAQPVPQPQDLSALGRMPRLARLRLHIDPCRPGARRELSPALLAPSLTSLSLRGVLFAPDAAVPPLPRLRVLLLSRSWVLNGARLAAATGRDSLEIFSVRCGSVLGGVRISDLPALWPRLKVLRYHGERRVRVGRPHHAYAAPPPAWTFS